MKEKKVFQSKFDIKLLVKDLFVASFVIFVLGFVLELFFRGIIISIISLNFWLGLTLVCGVIYLVLINNK